MLSRRAGGGAAQDCSSPAGWESPSLVHRTLPQGGSWDMDRGNSGSSTAGPGLSRALHAVPASGLPRSFLSQSTSPSAALMLFQHSLAAPPASSWAGCVLSPCPPSSAQPGEQPSLFYSIGLDLRVLLPLFSPISQPCPCFKNSSVCHLSPTSQDKSPQAKARVGICT